MESESRDHQHQAEACAGTHQSDHTFKEEDVPGLAEALAEVAHKWEEIAVALRLSEAVRAECREGSSLAMKLYRVLYQWVVGQHFNAAWATRESLKRALASPLVQYPQLASELEDKFKTSLSLHTHTTSQKSLFQSEFKEVLMKQYSQWPHVPRGSWPPVVSKKFINLALIETSDEPLKSDYSIEGDADEVLAEKTWVQYEDLFQVYQTKKKILILGRPGSGKTTLVHKLVRDWCAGKALQGAELVFLVSLRLLSSENDKMLSDILQNLYFGKNYLMKISDAIERTQGDRVCFILDGFDEYSPSNRKASVVSALLDKSHLVDAMIIVTSRPAAASAAAIVLDDSFNKIEVFGFSKSQIIEYINIFPFSSSSSTNTAHSQKLQNFLSSHSGVFDLCYLPVNCAIICFIYSTKPDHLPDTQTQIYALFTRLIIMRQLTSRDVSRQLDSFEDLKGQEAKDFKKLCSLAFDMTTQYQQVITRGPASSDEAHSLGLVTTDITARLSGYKNSYSFLHLTLQEFLAAYHLSKLNQEEQMSLIEKYGNTVNMRTVWKFYCGLVNFTTGIDRAEKLLTSIKPNRWFILGNLLIKSERRFIEDTPLFKVQCAYEAKQACFVQLASSRQMDFFSDIVLNKYDMSAIAYTMSMAATQGSLATPTTELHLQFWGPVDDRLKVFLSKLNDRALECLEDLKIQFVCEVSTATQAEALASKLSRMGQTEAGLKNLKSLDLSGPIGDKSLIVLANGLDGNRVLEKLEVLNNKISATGISVLMNSDCHLQHLNLSFNDIGDEGVAKLAAGLNGNCVLEDLILVGCGITAANICELVKADCHLQYLDLSCNYFGDEGAMAVAKGLEGNLSLKSINLSFSDIGIAGVEALAPVIQQPLSIDLSVNEFTSHFASCEGASFGSSLFSEARGFGSHDARVSEVQCSRDLQKLDLSSNNCYGDVVDVISKFNSLSSLDLSHNSIDIPTAQAIVSYVANSKNCQQLQYLGLSSILRDVSCTIDQDNMPYHLILGFIINLSYNKMDKTKVLDFLQSVKNYDRVGAVNLKGTNINIDENTIEELKKVFQHERNNRLIIFDISRDIYIEVPARHPTVQRKGNI